MKMSLVSISKLKDLVKISYRTKKPLLILGPVGVGKSRSVREAANEIATEKKLKYSEDFDKIDTNSFVLLDIRSILYDVGDIKLGMPQGDRIIEAFAEFLPREGQGIIFLDEFNLAPEMMQRLYYQLILDRRIGSSYRLPDGWIVVAAGNRSDDANVFDIMNPLFDRFLFRVEVAMPTVKEWTEWAINNGVDNRIIAFLNNFNQYLNIKSEDGYDLTTPRRWEQISQVIIEEGIETIEFMLPDGIAREFIAFIELSKKFNVEKIFKNEENVPEKMDEQYSILPALSDFCIKDLKGFKKFYKKNFKELNDEVKILLVRNIVNRVDNKDEIINDDELFNIFSKIVNDFSKYYKLD